MPIKSSSDLIILAMTTTSEEENSSQEASEKYVPIVPKDNRVYGKKEYWDERFKKEEEFEWLVSYQDVAPQIQPYLKMAPSSSTPSEEPEGDPRILLVGVGNSPFSSDLYDAGFTNSVSIDYSPVVIDAMREKNRSRPAMEWRVMDMTDMSEFEDESFDVVIDKAAMDAFMTNEGDVWDPDESAISQARSMCQHISRILKPGGYHLHISFAQPHFRRKYLLGLHNPPSNIQIKNNDGTFSEEFQWTYHVETIRGDENDGCFHHFLYCMQKSL